MSNALFIGTSEMAVTRNSMCPERAGPILLTANTRGGDLWKEKMLADGVERTQDLHIASVVVNTTIFES